MTERLCVAGITLGEDGVLTIERVKKDDEGLYECIAKNIEGIAKTSAVVTVLGKSFTHKHTNDQVSPAVILVSHCKFACDAFILPTDHNKYT